jgi:hypothetical protein
VYSQDVAYSDCLPKEPRVSTRADFLNERRIAPQDFSTPLEKHIAPQRHVGGDDESEDDAI